MAPVTIWYKDWPSSEHAYQASKFISGLGPNPNSLENDLSRLTQLKTVKDNILLINTPGGAKRIAKSKFPLLTRGEQDAFHYKKFSIMELIVFEKFAQNEDLRYNLLSTGEEWLEEGNSWGDTYWGTSLETGEGLNMLGIILMNVRRHFNFNRQ